MTHALPIADLGLLIKRLLLHLSIRRRTQLGFLFLLMLVSAVAEVISLGAVIPFLGILVEPDRVFRNSIVANIAGLLNIKSSNELVLPITILFAIVALIAGAIRILYLRVSTQLAFACGAELAGDAYRRTLYQPYSVHVSRNSSQVISGISKVNGMVFGVLLPLLTLLSSIVVITAISIALVFIDPMVALVAALGFGSIYFVITLISRNRLKRNSLDIAHQQTQVLNSLQEGLGGIRDVLLDGTQSTYCDIYAQADKKLRRAQGDNVFIGQSPRYIVETIGMALIAVIAYFLSVQSAGITAALPILGALALGAQRLLPALQQVYNSWANIAGSHASLRDAVEMLDQPLEFELFQNITKPLSFKSEIQLKSVCYRYSNEGPMILNGINLSIRKGARVGFIGGTGSGKSTTLDLIMGLLKPNEGHLLVDGKSIDSKRTREWQLNIAHVPQSIYLTDASLAENIAFGISKDLIDLDRVKLVSRQAQIAEFIENSPAGYDTFVGERGVRLSGGQRQRIGIARALYKQASVLVLDEATSSLDSETEKSVMESIQALNGELTILIIAHRVTTLKKCDFIVELRKGKIINQCTYQELQENSIAH